MINLAQKKILITGADGFLGKHLVRNLIEKRKVPRESLFLPKREELDLRKWENCQKAVLDKDIVFHLAANVGGIGFNQEKPGELFYDNAIMGIQLMEAARQAGVEKFIIIGTTCSYPEFTPLPFREKDLWLGYPASVTAPYGLAKKMLLVQGQAYFSQYGFNSIFLISANLYGPEDNFDAKSSHVIPALIKKFVDAQKNNLPFVEVWGKGKATREFLYVKDAAEGLILAAERYDSPEPVNLGTGIETPIKDLAELIADISGFKGEIRWDVSKPEGQPRRFLDVSKAKKEFGFEAKTSLEEGLRETIHSLKSRPGLDFSSQERKKIGWISISSRMDGGNTYGAWVRKALCKEFDVELKHLGARWVMKNLKWRYLKPLEWVFRFLTFRGEKDLWVIHSFLDLALLSLSRIKGKKLVMIYHIDTSVFPWFLKPGFRLVERIFYHNLKKADAIATISAYWQNHFLERGYPRVYKVYIGFPTKDFEITEQELSEFRKEHKLEGKPIIYIGNCQEVKGVVEAYQALKDLDVYLVTSGEQRVKIPARNFNLDRRNYLKLLAVSSIAVFMTRFETGWDMTAEEAMFFKTPVIGTPRGGFKELLLRSGQIICDHPNKLKEKVEELLNNPEERKRLGQRGYEFAKNFPIESFNEDWLKLIREILND